MTRPQQAIERRTPAGLTLEMAVQLTGFQPAEMALISKTVAIGAPLAELTQFLHACRELKLDPLLKQAYWIRRKQPDGSMRGGLQVGIDGFRSLADRQGNYAGSSEPTFRGTKEVTYKGKKHLVPDYCQVVAWKIVQGHKATFVGEARWDEFYPGETQGFMWVKMPHHMLAKVAEAQALRKGWPAQLVGLEMSAEADDAATATVTVDELPAVGRRVSEVSYDDIFKDDMAAPPAQPTPEDNPAGEKFKPYEERPAEELSGGHPEADWTDDDATGAADNN